MLQTVKEQLSKQGKITIKIFVTPKSAKNEIIDIQIAKKDILQIKAKIKGMPVNNNVNLNLIKFLAKELNIAKSNIEIIKGHRSREKTLIISK